MVVNRDWVRNLDGFYYDYESLVTWLDYFLNSLDAEGMFYLFYIIFFMNLVVLCLGLGNCCLVNNIKYFTKNSFKAEECSTALGTMAINTACFLLQYASSSHQNFILFHSSAKQT